MSLLFDFPPILSDGLPASGGTDANAALTGGLLDKTTPLPAPVPPPGTSGVADSLAASARAASAAQPASSVVEIRDAFGNPVATGGDTMVLGDSTLFLPQNGSQAFFTSQGISPSSPIALSTSDQYRVSDDERFFSYAGSDMRALLEIASPGPGAKHASKQLIELVTLSVSVHREKAQIRALGYINPKGFARGKRTCAGTMILTQFMVDVLYRFLDDPSPHDLSKDSITVKPDQLPPFNMTLLFADEYGNASYRRLTGIEFVTDGTTYSANDMITEQSVSYYAADFTPLLPMTRSGLLSHQSGITSAGRTVKQIRQEQAKTAGVWPL
jgi:hypothetical protein